MENEEKISFFGAIRNFIKSISTPIEEEMTEEQARAIVEGKDSNNASSAQSFRKSNKSTGGMDVENARTLTKGARNISEEIEKEQGQ